MIFSGKLGKMVKSEKVLKGVKPFKLLSESSNKTDCEEKNSKKRKNFKKIFSTPLFFFTNMV